MSSSLAIRQRSQILRSSAVYSGRSFRRSNATISSVNKSTSAAVKPLKSILIANRGEIALRVRRTASEYGIRTTTIYTDPDAQSQHALSSSFAINLGDSSQYLNGEKIIEVAKQQGCDAVHPGYGFLSENASFARKCTKAGLVFVGPPSDAIEAMGNKSRSKEIMSAAEVPCIPGYHGTNQGPQYLMTEAEKIGYPVLLKAVKGGGGKGMRVCNRADEFLDQLESAKSEARSSFGDDIMLVEKYITKPRHIEVQVFADKHGNCVALGERDCSIQRRHQKILEESPAPHLKPDVRRNLWETATAAALAVNYEGAGTVEFIFDNDTGKFYFMEMNTRLQVEHPVTEMVTGEDLVRWQLIVAEGGELPLKQQEVEDRMAQRGSAIEARIYAENPEMNFIPDSGKLQHLRTPQSSPTVRIDAGFVEGDEVSPFYDPMIAKLIVHGPDRTAALQKLRAALEEYEVVGLTTNIDFLKRLSTSPAFVAGDVETGYIEKHSDELFAKKIVEPEAFAQAALGVLLQQQQQQQQHKYNQRQPANASSNNSFAPFSTMLGFGRGFQNRTIQLTDISSKNSLSSQTESSPQTTTIIIQQVAPTLFNVTVTNNGDSTTTTYQNITSTFHNSTNTMTSYFPHTRLDSTFILSQADSSSSSSSGYTINDTIITLFLRGQQYRLQLNPPRWTKHATGINASNTSSSSTNSSKNVITAPMPCTVLRVDVHPGEKVKKNQPLVVIESMKMETVLRCPRDDGAWVKKVTVEKGNVCKAGKVLVEFYDDDDDAAAAAAAQAEARSE